MSFVVKVRIDNIRISLDDWDDAGFDEDGNFTQKAKEFAVNHMMEFVEDFGNKLNGFIVERVLVNATRTGYMDVSELGSEDFHELNANLKEINFDDWDDACLYISINKEIYASELNNIFLDMPKFGQFMVVFPNNVELITQLYDWGEYDTGYFADWGQPEEYYIIGFAKDDGSFKPNEERPYYEGDLKIFNKAIEMFK